MLNIQELYKHYSERKEEYQPLEFVFMYEYLIMMDDNKNHIADITDKYIHIKIDLGNDSFYYSHIGVENEHFTSVEEQMVFVIDKVTESLEYTQCQCDLLLNSIYEYFMRG